MRALIQRVSGASVDIVDAEKTYRNGQINAGLLVLLGIENDDNFEDISWLVKKICNLRVFEDENGLMNLSLMDKAYEILLISQFTLYGNVKKGSRPSFNRAAKADISKKIFDDFKLELENHLGKSVESGVFGAMMNVNLTNDGPITIMIDTKNKSF